jgi:LPXTG-motif cell wall-anchored protein
MPATLSPRRAPSGRTADYIAGMSRSRAIVALLALVLALPSAVFAQGAGDNQYEDPFPDEPKQSHGGGKSGGGGQTQGRAAQDDGLSDAPPVSGDDSGSDDGSSDSGSGDTTPPADDGSDDTATNQPKALPNTGSDPRILAFVGLIFVLTGLGLRLRTIDPDLY